MVNGRCHGAQGIAVSCELPSEGGAGLYGGGRVDGTLQPIAWSWSVVIPFIVPCSVAKSVRGGM